MHCGITKPVNFFRRSKNKTDKLQNRCKVGRGRACGSGWGRVRGSAWSWRAQGVARDDGACAFPRAAGISRQATPPRTSASAVEQCWSGWQGQQHLFYHSLPLPTPLIIHPACCACQPPSNVTSWPASLAAAWAGAGVRDGAGAGHQARPQRAGGGEGAAQAVPALQPGQGRLAVLPVQALAGWPLHLLQGAGGAGRGKRKREKVECGREGILQGSAGQGGEERWSQGGVGRLLWSASTGGTASAVPRFPAWSRGM